MINDNDMILMILMKKNEMKKLMKWWISNE